MRKLTLGFTAILFTVSIAHAQQPKTVAVKKPVTASSKLQKKYGSLLWEITGNGLKKPSYLFGTMHISDKLVFHLGDSFYNAIRSVEVVALETNPENWQDNYSESAFLRNRTPYGFGSAYMDFGYSANSTMSITSFSFDTYEEAIKAALAVEPSLVNGLLYRTYGNRRADFEEDTYLDMYIFQTGKKLGKKLAGVENFKESEKLVIEAYRDMMKDDKRKKRSFDIEGMYSNPKKMEEAYRKGDLDALDSLDALEVESDAFQEKFLYKRNEIQAKNIDSIMKKASLFVGVGAAHLPGKRGVIEMLREMGYTLRPVIMDDRNSRQKENIDKIRHTTSFNTQKSEDGFLEVNIPGKKFYNFTDWGGLDIRQFADMANGSYYMTVRVKTNSHFLGHSTETVHKKIDSLLYENIPGKILKKTVITRNGYKGWEVLNRIRRGDYQRYNIFVTPFEIVIFKMSGNGDYINQGPEAQQFFGSVKLKEYKANGWNTFQPATGGFSVEMPYTPSLLRDEHTGTDRLEYGAHDQQNSYLVIQGNFLQFSYAEEDSFELRLMDESYAYSSFIDKKISEKFFTQNGYPGLEATYLHKDGNKSTVKFMIRGSLYYAATVRYPAENEGSKKFIQSFALKPFIYPETKSRTDTTMRFSVQSPFFPDPKGDEELEKMISMMNMYRFSDEEDEESMTDQFFGTTKFKLIGNDTLGERISVFYKRPDKYTYIKDSASFWSNNFSEESNFNFRFDSTFIYKLDKRYEMPGGVKCREIHMTDTGSSRLIMEKFMYKDGHVFTLRTLTDTLNNSSFISKFFSSFTPADTLKGESVFTRKTGQFFADYFSPDSTVAKKARKQLYSVSYDSADVQLLKMAIDRINRKTRDYPEVKKHFISELGDLKDSTITPYLRDLYMKVKDTSDFQNAILSALLSQRTKASFTAFKNMILQETPVEPETGYRGYYNDNRYMQVMIRSFRKYGGSRFTVPENYYGNWGELYDTLSLTRTIFPDFLQLMNVDDYKEEVTNLLITMVDSGYLKASDYETWFSKLYLDAKQLLKKQMAREDADNMERESRKDKKRNFFDFDGEDEEMEYGNTALMKQAVLMMPFYDKNPGIPAFFDQLKKTRDKQLYYDACILLLRNNKPFPDSFLTKYAAMDKYSSKLYRDLDKMKRTELFPAPFKKQESLARSIFLEQTGEYNKPDSITYIDKLPVTYEKKKGWVYFFKYKQERDDNFWQMGCVGMQPEKQDSIDIDNDEFVTSETRKIKNDETIQSQMGKMLKELLNSKRPGASDFYDARRYNIYKSYMSDIVKEERFND